MFFKRIEMTGFKSFATKTVVEFIEGVTVVVGPNGCGKSNIFDAIRWVLGEQSPKSLRGTKMEDVIFQGSASYKPMGVAQVTLIIDNEDNRLPIDFSELSVARRLYRSGESEYLLNKIPCRLRDIQELFMDTGVGQESYSIMEQGRVDDIVKSRPEDRRELFEEAAGISKYKSRKAEALRKLARTEQDLLRLNDRIATSRTRTISLKRQASKAQRYKELRQEADQVEKKLLTLDMMRISEDFEKIKKVYELAEEKLTLVQAKNSEVETRREELLLKLEMADELLRDLSTQREDQRGYIHDASTEMMRLKNHAMNEQRRSRDLTQQLRENRVHRDEIAANLAETKADEARLTVRRIMLESEQNIRRAEYERMRADTDATRGKIREIRRLKEDTEKESQRLRHEQTRLQMQIQQAGSTMEEFNQQKADHETAIADIQSQIETKKANLESGRNRLAELQESLNQSQTEGMTELKARETLQAEHRKAERALDEAQSRLSALERLAKDYAGYYQGVKTVMTAASDHRLDGIIGVVPELIQSINSEHDLAIEVALGNHTQDIIMRSDDDAKRALQYLRQNEGGQATLIPLNVIDGREGGGDIDQVLRMPGIVGLASRLVTYDNYIEKAVFNLLGRTVVTETTDVSMQLIRQGRRQRYVSLDGDLTFPSGIMQGGSRRRNQSQVMTRQREITDLSEEVAKLEESEKDLMRRFHKRNENVIQIDAQCSKMREQIGELKIEVRQLETELRGLEETNVQRTKQFDQLRERAEGSVAKSENFKRDLETIQAKLAEVMQQGDAQQGELSLMEDAVYERNEEVDRLGENVSRGDQEITGLRERCRSLMQNADSLYNQLQNANKRHTQLINERESGMDSARNYLRQAMRVQEEKEVLEAEVAQIDERREKAAREKEEAQQATHRESEAAQKLRLELTESTNRYKVAQADFVNSEGALKNLREKAAEKFHISIEELADSMGEIEDDRNDLTIELDDLHERLDRMGDNINMGALQEYEEENARYEFMVQQQTDLMEARDSLNDTIEKVDNTSRQLFQEAFESIRNNFIRVYRELFGGGKADLILQDVEDGDPLLDGGIEVIAQPPGKKLQNVSLLSGGEKALTAVSLMFAIFLYKPSPFCVMDEIDAPLDDANVVRLCDMLAEFAKHTQFIIITHNKITMELADRIYGITMQETGVSSMVSVDFDRAEALVAEIS
ncbi:MAG: chromosome segregation protein SMC [Candidatus Sumerlaeia bacterium]